MSVYLIALTRADKDAWSKLAAIWPDRHHVVNDTMAFVAPSGIATATSVRDLVGISADPDALTGIVLRMGEGAGSGALPSETVNWLDAAQKHE